MKSRRILVETEFRTGDELTLDAPAAHYLLNVLRLRRGDRITLFDGQNREAESKILEAHRRAGCRVRLGEVRSIDRESPLHIHLLQAIARGDRFDQVVQKGVELGVSEITPIATEHTEGGADRAQGRLSRWQDIAVSACAQCGRNRLPIIHEPTPLQAIQPTAGLRMVPVPGAATRLASLDPVARQIELLIGPEGGLGPNDLAWCRRNAFVEVGLGPRVLRTETAGPAVLAILQALHGDG